MTAGESSRGTLTGIMGNVEQVVEESIRPSGCRHPFTMCQEPVAQVRKDACGNLLSTYCQVVELWSSDRQQVEDDIVGKE